MEKKINYYKNLLDKYIYNTIINVSEFAKCLGISLNDMTEDVGFSISAVSRIRNKVKKEPDKACDNLPYALCMLTSIDYICFFHDIKIEAQNKIKEMIFKEMCEKVILFYKADGEPEFTNNIENQVWYRVNHSENRGFVYQLKYFIYCKKQEEKSFNYYELESKLLDILKNCKISFTLTGYKAAQKNYYEICQLLKDIYKNNNKIYLSSFVLDQDYYGYLSLPNDDSYEIVKNEINININKDDYAKCSIDFIDLVLSENDNTNILLFVKDCDEKLYHKKSIMDECKDRLNNIIIYSYYLYFNDINGFKLVFDYKDTIFIANNNNIFEMYNYDRKHI